MTQARVDPACLDRSTACSGSNRDERSGRSASAAASGTKSMGSSEQAQLWSATIHAATTTQELNRVRPQCLPSNLPHSLPFWVSYP